VTYTVLRGALMVLGLLGVGCGIALLRPARTATRIPTRTPVHRPVRQSAPAMDLTPLVRSVPFRANRRPASARYRQPAVPSEQAVAAPAAPQKPFLSLTGLVLDQEPVAVVEGIPGAEGPVVLRVGETAHRIVLRSINGDHVVLSGFDTTWTLTVRDPWH